MTLFIFPSGSSYTVSQGLVNSDVYVSTCCKNFLFFVCTYHKNSLRLFSKGQLAREGGIWSFALLFMKVWEDLVYLLMFCQLCKLILVSVSLEIQPIYYIRNARKRNFSIKWIVNGSFVTFFKRWGDKSQYRERREQSVKDLIFSDRRLRSLPVCI